jgi:phosphoribosylformylglycinamidine synthase
VDVLHRLTISEADAPHRPATVLFLRGPLTAEHRQRLTEALVDPLLEAATWDVPTGDAIEVALHPGVTDDRAAAVLHAAALLDVPVEQAASGRRLAVPADVDDLDANPVIERWTRGAIEPAFTPTVPGSGVPEIVPIAHLDAEALAALNRERGLHLDPAELDAVQRHFAELGREPTDAELETLAQTWSEHCAHKTFRAAITLDDGTPITPLLRQLRDCTDAIAAPFVRSAFVGNAGIIAYRPGVSYALKAETHNHPSAIEPFGGANTGVGGVIRDVLGTGHRPIAATDILCFGPPDHPRELVPPGAIHPRRIRDGVIDGVADYGNKIGLPTVAGAVLYDPAYTTNPLVFCGCIGVGDDRPLPDRPEPGDRVIVLGGRTGRDGLRGATFSSATMEAVTGEVAGASVQIGDPITEKLLIDVIIGAEHLYRAITDCGAGGLSSAVGEMAEHLGADVDLAVVPLKYPGLEPWEIWLSEAQERMVLAVPPEHVGALRARCDLFGVELTDLGGFTGDGRLHVRHGETTVVDLDVAFLHDGRPQRSMTAVLPTPDRMPGERSADDVGATLLGLLAHRNIASKADVVHRYDHEIRGATLGRPVVGPGAGPGDGVALVEPGDHEGIVIGIGVNPWYGVHDPEAMAWAVIDEAVRNVVVAGGDPSRVALLDNFSWGDPRRPETLGALVATVHGCCDAAVAYGAPFVSGKDSLNNEYLGSDGRRHAVPPTLVITAVAPAPDAERVIGSDLVAEGDVLVLVGATRPEFAGSHLDQVLGEPAVPGAAPQPDPTAPARYRRIHDLVLAGAVRAAHDVSEGGLAVALAEMCVGGSLGARLQWLGHDDPVTALFAESVGRVVLEVAPGHVEHVLDTLGDEAVVLGHVITDPQFVLPSGLTLAVSDLAAAFHRRGMPA